MHRDELSSWLRLAATPGIGTVTARRLLAAFGLPQAIFEQSPAVLRQVVTHAQASALAAPPAELVVQLEATLGWLATPADGLARRIVALGDADYPAGLLDTEDPPLLLYLIGPAALLGQGAAALPGARAADAAAHPRLAWPARALAMVGTRNPTPQGRQNARQFARTLGEAGLTIVSGLALGIDSAAHEGALAAVDESAEPDHLATIAVIGTGIDRVYPRQNQQLARRIARHGLIVSEYPLGAPPLASNFPRRNRLIAGLAQGTLVVEAALQSGSLITARLAVEQGKDVFAIPGSIHTPQSRGCHALIRQGAKLVETARDVLEELRWADVPLTTSPPTDFSASAFLPVADEPGQAALLQALGGDPASLDALQARTGLDTATLQAWLLQLELDGRVGRLPGGLFQRIGQA